MSFSFTPARLSSRHFRSFIRRDLLLAGTAVAFALAPVTAIAQDEPAVEIGTIDVRATGESGVGPLLDVPTTAGSRLDLTPRETPASVDIIDGETVRERGETDVNQAIVRNAIGINFLGSPGNGGTAFAMRGFAGHASVTRLYDGVKLYPASGTITFPFDMWTVDRIEVLRGPASVLYGEGAIGGAINIVPKKPLTDSRRNEMRATFGTDGQRGLALGSAGPIDERFSYSLDVSGRGTDGWMDRGDASSFALSGSLRWQANEDLAFTLSHDHGYNKPNTYFGTPLIDGRLDERLRFRNYNVLDANNRFHDHMTQLRAEWQPTDRISVTSTTYHVRSDRNWRNVETYLYRPEFDDIQRTSYIAINHLLEQIGNRTEATFQTSVAGMDNRTAIGFEVNRVRFAHENNSPYSGESFVDPVDFDPGFFISPDPFRRTFDTTTTQYALFADNRLALNDQWSVVTGLRYDNPRLTRRNLLDDTGFTRRFDSLNWRVGTVYEPTPDLAFFAQYSRASEPIGNLLTLNDAQSELRLPRGEQYEAGVKYTFLDGRADATLSAYHIRKKGVLARDPDDRTIVRQIGQQSSEGIEAALGLDLGYGVRLEANGTVLNARFDDYIQADGDFSGNVPPNVPQYAANIYMSWAFAENWLVHGGLHHVGKTFTNDANTTTRPSYSVVNAGLQWRPTDMARVDFNVYNLFDEVYATSGGANQWYLGPPRSATLSLSLSF